MLFLLWLTARLLTRLLVIPSGAGDGSGDSWSDAGQWARLDPHTPRLRREWAVPALRAAGQPLGEHVVVGGSGPLGLLPPPLLLPYTFGRRPRIVASSVTGGPALSGGAHGREHRGDRPPGPARGGGRGPLGGHLARSRSPSSEQLSTAALGAGARPSPATPSARQQRSRHHHLPRHAPSRGQAEALTSRARLEYEAGPPGGVTPPVPMLPLRGCAEDCGGGWPPPPRGPAGLQPAPSTSTEPVPGPRWISPMELVANTMLENTSVSCAGPACACAVCGLVATANASAAPSSVRIATATSTRRGSTWDIRRSSYLGRDRARRICHGRDSLTSMSISDD